MLPVSSKNVSDRSTFFKFMSYTYPIVCIERSGKHRWCAKTLVLHCFCEAAEEMGKKNTKKGNGKTHSSVYTSKEMNERFGMDDR
jgi:hypothetical protein